MKSRLLELLPVVDNVMADKGFNNEDVLTHCGLKINIPPFMSNDRLSHHDLKLTYYDLRTLQY